MRKCADKPQFTGSDEKERQDRIAKAEKGTADGKLVVQLRDDKPGLPYPNCWATLGGGIEPNEEPDAAMQRELIEELDKENLRPRIKVMVGGAPITRDWATKIKADGTSEDAVGAVALAKQLVGKA